MRIPHNLPNPTSGSVDTPQDKIALIAQKYAGYFAGHLYRFDQQAPYVIITGNEPDSLLKVYRGIRIEKKAWKEPVVFSDDCEFCKRLTDESAESRVAGYQHQLDIEILRVKGHLFRRWLDECGPDVVDKEMTPADPMGILEQRERGSESSAANARAFCRVEGNRPRTTASGKERPDGWERKPTPMVDLPLRLKRKMCIEWNHVYTDYIKANPEVYYDFEKRMFFKEMPNLGPAECCGGARAYNSYGNILVLHTEACTEKSVPVASTAYGQAMAAWLGGWHF